MPSNGVDQLLMKAMLLGKDGSQPMCLLGSSSSRSFLGVNNDLHDKDLAFQHRHFNGISVFLIAKKDGSNYDLRLD